MEAKVRSFYARGWQWGLRAAALFVVLFARPAVQAQSFFAIGAEFQVNTFTTGNQYVFGWREVSTDGNGNFVVAWRSDFQDGEYGGVFAQRYDSNGAPLGSEFQVNSSTLGNQTYPAVAADPAGNFVVVWQDDYGVDGDAGGIFGQRFSSNGAAAGSEFQINANTVYGQEYPFVETDADGDFVVVWASAADMARTDLNVMAQRYSSDGTPVGTEFQVNTYTTGVQYDCTVSVDDAGNFVVVWEDADGQDGNGQGAFAQRFGSNGSRLGDEFQLNTYTTNDQYYPSVTLASDGAFIAWWNSDIQDGSEGGVFAQRYASDGTRAGTEFQVNTYTTGSQLFAQLTLDAAGKVFAVWGSAQDGDGDGVFGQQFDANNAPIGAEFQINTYTTASEQFPAAAMTATGEVLVVWLQNGGQDGDGEGVFAQRLRLSCPASPSGSCGTSTKGKLLIKDSSDDTKDKLVWKWGNGSGADTQSAFGDPTASTNNRLCVYDDGVLKFEANVPAGADWEAASTTGYKFKGDGTSSGGIQKMKLKSGAAGTAKILAKGKGGLALPAPASGTAFFNQTTSVTVQLHSSAGNCWGNSFSAAQSSNEADQFKAKF